MESYFHYFGFLYIISTIYDFLKLDRYIQKIDKTKDINPWPDASDFASNKSPGE